MILKTIFAITFGGSGKYRFRIALLKLCSLLLLSLAVGYQLGSTLRGIMNSQPWPLVYSASIFLVQVASLCACLSIYGVIFRQNKIYQLLQYLPTSKKQLYICHILPLGVIAVLIVPLLGVPLFMAMHYSLANTLLLLMVILLGTASGMGFVWGKPASMPRRIWWLLSVLAIWSEFKLLQSIAVASQSSPIATGLILAISCCLASLFGIYGLRNLQPKIIESTYLIARNKPLPLLLKKALRSAAIQLSTITSAALGLSYVLLARRQPIIDVYTTGTTIALLGAILACDFRALSRLVLPVEIANLRGTLAFMWSLLAATIMITTAALLPVLLLKIDDVLVAAGFLLFGIGTGLLVGNILSPKSNDITGQCFSVLICLAIIIGASKQQAVLELSPSLQCMILVLTGMVGFIAATLIEFKRNYFTWRKYASSTHTK